MRLLAAILLLLLCFGAQGFAQCGCGAGASVGGLTPASGSANVGVLREKNIRSFLFYSRISGNSYYTGDMQKGGGDIESFSSDFIGFNAGWGVSRRFTVETEFGYFLNKTQKFFDSDISARGPSHLSFIGKYNVLYDFENSIEITAGGGIRIPMPDNAGSIPQHARPSSGAYGGIIHVFIYKGFDEAELSLFYLSRTEINTKNADGYRYGHSSVNSIFLSKSFFSNLNGILEIRSEYRRKDTDKEKKVCDSGGALLVLSPQISFAAGKWNFSAMYGYPLYSWYNGTQLGRNGSFSLSVSFETDL